MKGTAVAMGNFDGVHRAHAQILARAGEFQNLHPVCVLFRTLPAAGQGILTMPDDREALIRAQGVRELCYLEFDHVKRLSPREFFEEYLIYQLHAKVLLCGYNYTFGREKSGTVAELEQLCREHDVALQVLPQVEHEGNPISSTRIRTAIRSGDIEQANAMLGRPFGYHFEVVDGRHLGRTLGTPTINQLLPEGFIRPKAGVYAAKVLVDGVWKIGITNIGSRPTVGGTNFRSETYILNYDGDLYGQEIPVQLHQFIRPEQAFDSVETLKKQILADAETAKELLG